MFKNSDSKIGVRECAALIIIILFTKSTDDTITNFFKAGKNAGWMTPLFSGLTILLPISCILCLLRRYEDKGLIEIIYRITGKYVGFILSLIFFALNIIILIGNIMDNSNTLNTLFFPMTSRTVLIFSLIGTSCFMATLGLKAAARTSWLMLLYIELSLIILLVCSYKLLVFNFIFPISGSGMKNVMVSGLSHASIYQGIILLSVCYPLFKNYKSFKNASLIGLLLSAFQLSCICLFLQMILDYPAISIVSFPLYTLIRLINVTRFITNLEALFLLPSIISLVIYFSAYLYLISAILAYILKFKKIERLILPIGIIVAILSLIPENSTAFSILIGKKITTLSTIFLIILPLILLVISQLKGDYKKC